MKYVVPFLVLAAFAGGCGSFVDSRLEKADLKLEEAEDILQKARKFGDPAGIAAAEAAVERSREAVRRAEEAAQSDRERSQAFWTGIFGVAVAGANLAAGLAAKGAKVVA